MALALTWGRAETASGQSLLDRTPSDPKNPSSETRSPFEGRVQAENLSPEAIARSLNRLAAESRKIVPPDDRLLLLEDASVEQADWRTDTRRLYLDLIGAPPSLTELEAANPARGGTRDAVVERLLSDRRFGQNWGRYWRDTVFAARSEANALIASGSFERYLAEAFNANRPWSEIVSEMIVAEGDVFENGQTGLIFAQGGRPEETAAEMSRLFLGIQISCAQCHDHPWDDWTRQQFHELAAFFPRVSSRPVVTEEKRTFVVESRDVFPRFLPSGGNNRFVGTAEHRMPDLDQPELPGRVIKPAFFLNGQSVPLGSRDRT